MEKGFFITFEGPDGSGKTTILEMVASYFNDNNIPFIKTREPGGSLIAEEIRTIILNPENKNLSYKAEALLYAASRAQHFDEVIVPALNEDKIVLCDRFIDSSLVYQGVARNLGIENILKINEFAIDDFLPDLTIFFDVSPEIGLKRIAENKIREVNRLDLESITFHEKVYEGYLKIHKTFDKRIVRIDASKGIDEVFTATIKVIEERYNGKLY